MVLESILNPIIAEKHPGYMFLYGFCVFFVALLVSVMVLRPSVSMGVVFFTVIATAPLMYLSMKREEKLDENIQKEKLLLKHHYIVVRFLLYLFIGITVACALCYALLPSEYAQQFFSMQISTIDSINGPYTGKVLSQLTITWDIFTHNLWVMLYCLVFSFLYGIGAMFIITWNATVIGTAIGRAIDSVLAVGIGEMGVHIYFLKVFEAFFMYALHGIPEIGAYFIGGMAGGILSVAIVNKNFTKPIFYRIGTDSLSLFSIAVLILFLAALIEVFVTPVFF